MKHASLWDGCVCLGTIAAEMRGTYVAIFCRQCGEVLGAMDPRLYRALVKLIQVERVRLGLVRPQDAL